jgi:hypothetical protein
LEYGHGKEINYNFSKIELELAFSLVAGKSMIGILFANLIDLELDFGILI